MTVVDAEGKSIGKAVEALVECDSGKVSYVVIASGGFGGVDESLRAVARDLIEFKCDRLNVDLNVSAFDQLPRFDNGEWPAPAATTA